MQTKKMSSSLVVKYFLYLVVCLILAKANLGSLSPFLFAFYFAGLYVGVEEKLLSFFTLVSFVLVAPSLENLFIAITVVAVGLICFYIHKFAKKKIAFFTTFIAYLISLVCYIYYNYGSIKNLIFYILLGLICLYVFIVVLQTIELKKNCFKLTLDEGVCMLFALSVLSLGLAGVEIFGFSICRFVVMFAILLLSGVNSAYLTFSIAISLSLGVGIYEYSLMPVAEFAIICLVMGIFSQPNKLKVVISSILVDGFIQYFFILHDYTFIFAVLPIAVAGLVYLFIPNRELNKFNDFVYVKRSELSSRNLINTTRKNLRKRMCELSNVFLEMKQLHTNMIKKELNKDELVAMLNREVMSNCCKNCLDKNRCTRSLGTDNKSNLATLLEIAVTKGKVTLLDIPSGLTSRCGQVNNLISLINRLVDEYKQYKHMMADVNNVKILLADQMGAVSKLLLDLGQEIDTNVTFDIARENKIIARLLNKNIECREVLIYAEKNDDISAVLIVKSENSYNQVLEKVLTETLKVPMRLSSVKPIEDSNFNAVTFKKRTKHDCIFGLASCNKSGNEECGDCHSIIRLGKDKFLLALCDGMGAGKSAHKMSAMTLGLIEDFYKVGFDNDIILESVNKLLAINNQENYSTLDICLLDLDKNLADFIKVGAPFGVIKRDGNVEVVEGGSLPIGALDSIKPSVYKTTISTKDLIVMATDGVMDTFAGVDEFEEFVLGLANSNPQTIAENILNEALIRNNMSAKDDMTVLVARTILKN